jgi:NTE family protein
VTQRALPPSREPRRTLVLPGGGSKAAWQVGACEHLIGERGYWFDIITGVSAGAVNGATLAQAHNPKELEEELEHLRTVWFGLRGNHDIYSRRWLGPLGMVLGRRASVYDSAPLYRVLLEHIDPPRVAASPVQLLVGYVDLVSGRYRTAGNDDPSLREVVLASCALPLLFPPIPLRDGQELGVDGGVRNMIPVLDALRVLAERPPANEPDEIWILSPYPLRPIPEARIGHWLTVARRCVSVLTDEAFAEAIERARQINDLLRLGANPNGRRDVALRVLHPRQELNGSILDFDPAKLRAWYEDGVRTAREGEALEV